MRPHCDRQRRDTERRVDQAAVAEDRFAAEDRKYLRDDTEEGQRDDVDLGVAEEPEQVLPQQDSAIRGVEDVATEATVVKQCEECGGSTAGRPTESRQR